MIVLLSRKQLRAVVSATHKYSPELVRMVRVMPDGTTESTDGKILVRISSEEDRLIGRSFFIEGAAARKAGRDMKTKNLAQANLSLKTLNYVDKKENQITIRDAIRLESPYPPTDTVVDAYGKGKAAASTRISVPLMKKLIGALDGAGCETMEIEFLERKLGLRITATAEPHRVCGIIAPLTVEAP